VEGEVISISFDDAYECVYRHAYPILDRYGIPATVFVIADYIGKKNLWDVPLSVKRERHLNKEQIHELVSRGWEIGSHTLTHRCLTILGNGELKEELEISKKRLEDLFGVEVKALSVPFGRLNQRVADAALGVGYKIICGFFPFRLYYGRAYIGEIPRLAVYSIDGVHEVLSKVGNNKSRLFREVLKQNIINFCANGTILVKSLG